MAKAAGMKNYFCEGQMNIWDFLKTGEENQDDLPELESVAMQIEARFNVKFKKREYYGSTEYYFKYKQTEFYIADDFYVTEDDRQGKRFVAVDWNAKKMGYGGPCDNMTEVITAFKDCFARADKLAEEKKKEKPVEVDIKGYCGDPYCPKCNYNLYGEEKAEECPVCGVKLDWKRYLRYAEASNE